MVEAPITVNVAYDPEIDVGTLKPVAFRGLMSKQRLSISLSTNYPAVTDFLEENGRLDCRQAAPSSPGGRPWATSCRPHGALFQFVIPARPA
jgi:hypothetical protein